MPPRSLRYRVARIRPRRHRRPADGGMHSGAQGTPTHRGLSQGAVLRRASVGGPGARRQQALLRPNAYGLNGKENISTGRWSATDSSRRTQTVDAHGSAQATPSRQNHARGGYAPAQGVRGRPRGSILGDFELDRCLDGRRRPRSSASGGGSGGGSSAPITWRAPAERGTLPTRLAGPRSVRCRIQPGGNGALRPCS
jgi:hypothetical protein